MATAKQPEGYCVRCKQKVTLLDAQQVKFKNGRPALKGACSDCGTTVYRILPKTLADV